jgi:hypothetical protein
MVLTVSFALSPVTGLSCHRRRRNCFRRLDASVGASGPHDFAVRFLRLRQERIRVHRIPPRACDDRETPLVKERDGIKIFLSLPGGQEKIRKIRNCWRSPHARGDMRVLIRATLAGRDAFLGMAREGRPALGVVPAKAGTHHHGCYCCAKLEPRRARTTTAGGYGSRVALSLARDDIEVFGFRPSRQAIGFARAQSDALRAFRACSGAAAASVPARRPRR